MFIHYNSRFIPLWIEFEDLEENSHFYYPDVSCRAKPIHLVAEPRRVYKNNPYQEVELEYEDLTEY
jgi:hypothetical protein